LNDEIDVVNIESSSSNICSYKNLKLSFFESLHCYFSLVLIDISMHYFNILLDLVSKDKIIGISFGLTEDNCLSSHSVADKYVSECTHSVLIWAINCEMLHFFCSLVL
jgi:hypothetical protein